MFQGSQVYDQPNYAILQDLGSSLATLQAAKVVDFFGCLLGHVVEVVDAEQAYVQAEMKGDPLPGLSTSGSATRVVAQEVPTFALSCLSSS